jgi:predicted metal-dependent hydrolase
LLFGYFLLELPAGCNEAWSMELKTIVQTMANSLQTGRKKLCLGISFLIVCLEEARMSDVSLLIAIDGVGPVLLARSSRARRLTISVRPFKGVRVAVPRSVSFKGAELAIRNKIQWMQKTVARMKLIELEHAVFSSASDKIDRHSAKKILMNRLDELATRHGFTYNRASVRNQKTRWGSCSAANNISLNMKLAELPEELMDYVILHELLHTRIKNHAAEFWAALDLLVGDAKALRRKMRGLPAAILLS